MDSHCRIIETPSEIMLKIFSNLSYPDMMGFMQTCETIREVCKDRFFWKTKIKKDLCDMTIRNLIRGRLEGDPFEAYHSYFVQKVDKMKCVLKYPNQFFHIFLTKRDLEDLLNFGINPDFGTPSYTLLMYACDKCEPDMIQCLLDKGASINLRNKDDSQKTAFNYALKSSVFDSNKRFESLNILEKNGGLLSIKNELKPSNSYNFFDAIKL